MQMATAHVHMPYIDDHTAICSLVSRTLVRPGTSAVCRPILSFLAATSRLSLAHAYMLWLLPRPDVPGLHRRMHYNHACLTASWWQVLQSLSQEACKPQAATYACFNPYLPDSKDRQQERDRLKAKLDSNVLSGIYLQMGADLSLLDSGLRFLRSAVQAAQQDRSRPVTIHGSVFVPTKR